MSIVAAPLSGPRSGLFIATTVYRAPANACSMNVANTWLICPDSGSAQDDEAGRVYANDRSIGGLELIDSLAIEAVVAAVAILILVLVFGGDGLQPARFDLPDLQTVGW